MWKSQPRNSDQLLDVAPRKLLTICLRLRQRIEFTLLQRVTGSYVLLHLCFYISYLEAVLSLHLALWRMWADPLSHAGHQVAHSLWGGEDIERWWQGTLVIKVAKPQFGPSKLPLFILVILQRPKSQQEHWKHSNATINFHTLFPKTNPKYPKWVFPWKSLRIAVQKKESMCSGVPKKKQFNICATLQGELQ